MAAGVTRRGLPCRPGNASTHPLLEDDDDIEEEESNESLFESAGEGKDHVAWESSDPLAELEKNILVLFVSQHSAPACLLGDVPCACWSGGVAECSSFLDSRLRV